MTALEDTAPKPTWKESFSVYIQPRVLAMLFLGFSAGLPLLLVFGTLSAWLREVGVDRSTIGHISWVAIIYGFKFIWAPLVDRLSIPVLSSTMGHRRSWMLLAQVGVITALYLMGRSDPNTELALLVVAALLVAFSSATQDISIDAWRIEAAVVEWQGAMAATYQIGYRLGMIVAGAGALYMAEFFSWSTAYSCMAGLMLVGVFTTFFIGEPVRQTTKDTWLEEERVVRFLQRNRQMPDHLKQIVAWFIGAVVCPFTDFFARNGRVALLILAFIGVFRLSDITMGIMANPFYIDMGYSKSDIASVTKIFGLIMTMFGAVLGGLLVARFGVMRILLLSAVLVALTNLTFVWLAGQTAEVYFVFDFIPWGPLAYVISADNLSGGMAGSAFIAYLSGLTNKSYTATQYALFSSLMLLPAKFLGGFSGDVVDAAGYEFFFSYAACLGLPAILLVLYLMHRKPLS